MPIFTTRGAASAKGFGFTSGGAAAFIGTLSIATDVYNYDIRSSAISGGWPGAGDANITVTVSPGVFVKSTSTGTASMQLGSPWPAGSTITLNNQGIIVGKGGNGGDAGQGGEVNPSFPGNPGGAGGTGLSVSRAININNTGTIAGGGGGGSGGGGSWIAARGVRPSSGGGGGGGIGESNGGTALGNGPAWGAAAQPGQPGSKNNPGAGGQATKTGFNPGNPTGGGAPGGAGGGYGSAGGVVGGGVGSNPGSGGTAGTAISGYPNINFINTGTISGPTS